MVTYQAVQVTGSRKFELVTRELRPPASGQVRLRIRPMTETRSLAEAPAACEHMLSGAARFRAC